MLNPAHDYITDRLNWSSGEEFGSIAGASPDAQHSHMQESYNKEHGYVFLFITKMREMMHWDYSLRNTSCDEQEGQESTCCNSFCVQVTNKTVKDYIFECTSMWLDLRGFSELTCLSSFDISSLSWTRRLDRACHSLGWLLLVWQCWGGSASVVTKTQQFK